jgi:hypothetical protein
MSGYRFLAPMYLGLCLLAVAGCAPQSTVATSQAQAPPVGPGMARVWFWRQPDPPGGNVEAATPVISANDAPVSEIKEGTAFCFSISHQDATSSRYSYRNPHGRARHPSARCRGRGPIYRSDGYNWQRAPVGQ